MLLNQFLLIGVFSLQTFVSSLNLNCDRENIDWYHIDIIKSCVVKNADFTSIDSTITSVNNKVKLNTWLGLKFHKKTVRYFPRGIGKFVENLQALEITYCKLKLIERDDLEPFVNLKVLILSNNLLETLDSDLFEFNTKLEYIDFDSNPLKHIGIDLLTSLIYLEEAWFENCDCISDYGTSTDKVNSLIAEFKSSCSHLYEMKMKKKYCSHDVESLDSLDGSLNIATRQLFMASQQLKPNRKPINSLKIDQKISLTCKRKPNSDIWIAVNFKVEEPNSQLIEMKDEKRTSIGLSVLSLEIINQQTFYLPLNLSERLPIIEDLTVASSGLFEISPNTFGGMNTLSNLRLTSNKLHEITSDSFSELGNLQTLDLSQNRLELFETGAFNGLEKLQKLNLGRNSLEFADFNVFRKLTSLTHLLLRDNKLKFISANLLTPSTHIESLDFSGNVCIDEKMPEKTIKQIAASFSKCVTSIKLTCKSRRVPTICKATKMVIEDPISKVSTITEGSSVTTFIVTDQSIRFMPQNLASVFPKLQSIRVDKSGLTSLQRIDFKGLTKLKTIDICNNLVTVISEGTFDEVQQIEHLDLSMNQIESLEPKVFFHLVHLKTLTLSGNKIQKLTLYMMPPNNAIETLKLDNNKLNLIDRHILKTLTAATTIDLTGNECIDYIYMRNVTNTKLFKDFEENLETHCSFE